MTTQPHPLAPHEVPRLHLRYDSLFTRSALEEHARDYPGLSWTNEQDEYISGGRWKARDEIGEVLELSGPGRSFRGLLPAPRIDTTWSERRSALIEALVGGFAARGARLVVLSDREVERNLTAFRESGFEPVEDIVYFRKPDVRAPAPGNRLHLEPLQFGEIPRLMALERRVFPWLWLYGEDEWFMITMLTGVETNLAYLDGQLVGYETHTVRNTHGHLDRIGIDPDLQGQGLGEELLRHAIRRIGELGGRDIGLSTQRANRRAQRLYEKYRFRDSGRNQRFFGRVLEESVRAQLSPVLELGQPEQ